MIRVRGPRWRGWVLGIGVGLAATTVAAQEPGVDPAPSAPEELVVDLTRSGGFGLTPLTDADGRRFLRFDSATPIRVYLRRSGRTLLEADRAVVWMPQAAGARPAGGTAAVIGGADLIVYAEGHVRFTPGSGKVVRAQRLYVDWGRGVAHLRGTRLETRLASDGTPLVLTAERLRVRYADGADPDAPPEDEILAEGVHLGTCEFGHPHYAVTATRVRLTGSIGRRALQDHASAEWIALRGVGAELWGVPVFWFPGLSWNLDWDSPIRSFEAGTSRATGPFVRTLLGVTLREEIETPEGRRERRRVGEAGVRLEGFAARGWGAGMEARWHGRHRLAPRDPFGDRPRALDLEALGIGWVDHGDPREADAPPGLWPEPRNDRGRVHAFGRYTGLAGWRIGGEGHWLSDRNVLRELAERVRQEDKDPETYGESLIHWGPFATGLLARPRWNDFQTQTEYLPRWRTLLWGVPLFGPSALSLSGEAANVRRSFDAATGLRPYRTGRLDGQATLDLRPLDLWEPLGRRLAFVVSGFARYSAWTRDVNPRGGTDRTAIGAAAILRTEFHRVFGSGADRFRHVVAPELRWETVSDVNRAPAELLAFDQVELLDEVERVSARLRTGIEVPDGAGHREWLLAEVTGTWFPRPHRDNGGDRSGDAIGELRWAPRVRGRVWRFWTRGTWRMPDERLTAWEAGGTTPDLFPGFALTLASYNVVDTLHVLAATADWRFNARWSVHAQYRYDLERGRPEATRVVLRRVLHRWVLEGGVSVDHGNDDVTAIVAILPLGLGGGAGPFARNDREGTLGIEGR